MGVVQLGVVQLGVVQLGVVQMGVDRGRTKNELTLFLDALASHAFKLSVSESVSHTFSDLQSIQFLQSLGL